MSLILTKEEAEAILPYFIRHFRPYSHRPLVEIEGIKYEVDNMDVISNPENMPYYIIQVILSSIEGDEKILIHELSEFLTLVRGR